MGVSIANLYDALREATQEDVELFEDKLSQIEPVHTDDGVRERFLQPTNVLPWSLLDQVQQFPQSRDTDYKDFLTIPEPINRTSFHLRRKGIDGHVSSYEEEVDLKEVANANAANSLSLNRGIDTHSNSVRGSTAQLPFMPGGVSMTAVQTTQGMSSVAASTKMLHKDDQGLFDVPRGFDRGIEPSNAFTTPDNQDRVDELQELDQEDNELEVQQEVEEQQRGLEDSVEEKTTREILGEEADIPNDDSRAAEDIDELLPMGIDFARNVVNSKGTLRPKEWAHVVDLHHKIDNFEELIPNPARTWPFELDTFQKEAVYHLEQGDSVFVAAHTSAGKTVVAEYAIAMAKRNMTKTIYTSPIKALSNQKFRDFRETFEDVGVGLITGDVQINPEAGCLIMTTEILRSMLYRGADLIRDVEFVIFDEVHYVNDQDRGVVWEEVIIMLPQHVKFILLSATVPNTYEFANWIGRTKQKNIYVISTPKRPVPLEINVWAKNEMIPVINSNKQFLEANFKKHKELLDGKPGSKENGTGSSAASRGGSARGGRGGRGGSARGGFRGAGAVGSNKSKFFKKSGPNKKTWPELVNHLRSKDLLPAVVFVFSKKRCEEYADWLEGVNFCNGRERSQIHMFIEKSVTRLRKEDRELPQIIKIRSLLERGIAVHHGGLLPIVKELIEMVFAKGLIRVLFATETFAMGLNLPTRTVVFSEIEKHDGQGLRFLNPGEFTQMAGRAGRRGLDKTGTVIVMTYTDPLPVASFKEVTMGVPTKLESQFRLTYNMILNLLRIEALKVEEMIKYSFSENSKQTLLPEHEQKIKELQQKLQDVRTYDDCEYCKKDIDQFLNSAIKLKECTAHMMEELVKTDKVYQVLRMGRLLLFRDENDNLKLGFVFRIHMKKSSVIVMTFTEPNTLESGEPNHLPYMVNLSSYTKRNFSTFKTVEFFMEEIPITSIELTTAYSIKVSFTDLMKKQPEALKMFDEEVRIILKIAQKFRESTSEKQGSLKVHQYVLERNNIQKEISTYQALSCPNLAEHFVPKYKAFMIERDIKELYHLMSDQNLNLLPDYEKRLAVLKDAGFIDQNHNVSLKGRVACEINSGYELVITELILDNFLGDFEPEEIVALLSSFVYEGRTREEEPPVATPRLARGKKRIEEIYSHMLEVVVNHQIPLTQEEAEFLDKKRFAMMNVVYEWARGLSFKEIMEISVEAEGTVVRVITWLDEICRQVKTASIIIGNSNLHMKMSQAQELIKRDIVFAASLYL
ncbi:hypothetical protein ZYGR_0H03770 [Zygosaccharomyces rouxii]|uniref:ZYRO0B12650p n=2 Tax=Zygosaccharomyces rouxii TaxID=4956 RepID=C5DRZ9_ZYGRC|nr:uncharacterized protein ZYRO0B12650g [Zygosaccharomyces rouxii]KAH9199911.1 NUC185 domain-containing protein [Zygosaccharomyces rouxii]GAV47532.1 hypothetical protein ZYGR_0H03770 [Zygosaccharomyces rouxii]CAR26560.1 ZYRO0B12650p [Zygosaccharomyces rouxii]